MPVRSLIWSALVSICTLSSASAQQVAGSVEAGLQALAQALLAATPADQRPTLSVMPFPNADQSCPVLSVFVVDELTTTLVSAVRPRPRVVERQQLETIIAQNRLDAFLTDPEQRRRLGGLSGVGALVMGSFVVIGDRLRINARLVAIDSGETIAAEAVSVPRTGEIAELLRQSSGRGKNCLANVAAAPRPVAGSPVGGPATAAARPAPSDDACDEDNGVRVCARNLRRNGQNVQVSLVVENVSEAAVAVGMVGPAPSLTDNDGTTYSLKQVTGLPMCGNSLNRGYMEARSQDFCLYNDNAFSRHSFRGLPPGGRASALLQFNADQTSQGAAFTLSAALGVLPRMPSALPAAEAEKLRARPLILMLPDVRPDGAQR